jgi:tripartite-type tricarboxylate transporter receptor subunit TctC
MKRSAMRERHTRISLRSIQATMAVARPTIQGSSMRSPVRLFLHLAAMAAAFCGLAAPAWSQAYPARPVHVLVGFPGGSSQDIVARMVGAWLSARLGQPFIIDNRPGAGGNIAVAAAANAAPDGYTLLMIGPNNAVNATLYDNLSFDFIRDIAPVGSIMRVPLVMEVNLSVPAVTVAAFIAYAKANRGKINMASAGNGTATHVAGELFKMMAGVDMVHVPYRGTPPAMTDLFGGRVQVIFDNMPGSIGYIRAGKLRPLAVTTAIRSDLLPEVPALSEFVPGYEASAWYGVGAPRSTPAAVIDTLNREINAALADPLLRARLIDIGGATLPGSPADLRQLIAEEKEKWGRVVRFSGAKPD